MQWILFSTNHQPFSCQSVTLIYSVWIFKEVGCHSFTAFCFTSTAIVLFSTTVSPCRAGSWTVPYKTVKTTLRLVVLHARQGQSTCGMCAFLSSSFSFSPPPPDFSPGANNMIGLHLCSPLLLLIGSLGLWAGLSPFGDLNKKSTP